MADVARRADLTMLDVDALWQDFWVIAEMRKVSIRLACRQAGINVSVPFQMRRRCTMPNSLNLIRMLVWMGTTDLEPYIFDIEPTESADVIEEGEDEE
jgi:gamma-glutamyl-gamma-aminobutyrate hydrolase PuuD